MKVTLQENGRKRTQEIAEKPTEGKWFKVNPLTIDQMLFKEERITKTQEQTRIYILQAFEEMKKKAKYTKPFKTMIPEKTWESKTVGELKKHASKLGDHIADWVEQALEWAQRIANGETWESVCDELDNATWYRLVVLDKNSGYWIVGGARDKYSKRQVSYCIPYQLGINCDFENTVPLVVDYE